MRTSIATACAKATAELKRSGKSVYSDRDIRVALTKARRGSTSSMRDYMGHDGHLAELGFLVATVGGYELSPSSMEINRIVIEIDPANKHLIGEVSDAIGRALMPFHGVATEAVEVS